MSLDLTLRLVEAVGTTAAGSTVLIDVDGPGDVEVAQRWAAGSNNTVLAVHPDAVEIYRGRMADPIKALSPDRRPGYRLWVYTNFHCNLSCDYCCVSSSPKARRRIIATDEFAQLVDEAGSAGGGGALPDRRRALHADRPGRAAAARHGGVINKKKSKQNNIN